MAKKKKLEDDAWMWMSQPFLPGLSIIPGLTDWQRMLLGEFSDQSDYPAGGYIQRGEHGHEGFTRAMKEYAVLALLDPSNIPEAHAWSLALGIGYGGGMALTLAKGLILGPPILAAIDPQHRWAGGLDEMPLYQEIVPTKEHGWQQTNWLQKWQSNPNNPENW
jgi:hypothetical protein